MTFQLGGFSSPKVATVGETDLEDKVPEWTKEDEENLRRRVRCVATTTDFQWCIKHGARWKVLEEWCEGPQR